LSTATSTFSFTLSITLFTLYSTMYLPPLSLHPLSSLCNSTSHRIILTKYLCDYKGDEKLSCVVTLCSPWDMFATSWALNTFPSKQLYNQYLCGELKKLALRYVSVSVSLAQ
jgi:hypothetical protein